MNDDVINENVAEIEKYLRKVDYIIRLEGRQIINQLNITIPQFTALQILIHNGNLTIGELSQKMSLACSTITDLIDRMEKSQLVARRKDEKDKRVVIVEVLPKGYDILEKVLKKRREYLSSQLIDFEIEEMETLRKGLEGLYNAMKE
ncbi:MarR family winged helix-turn-helix transcriptional regulator [Wansuia hejianensis]|uniref:MarR family transcriptional regulator n=1 Tax=Wansuia hejianensis TaxID=2763667 RepID=A0A926EW02_9FIRM|nr:MarR family transcriptional regulator [Wansuia hejianensis]MBC8589535.1 MarR family transcriptional regulator [Wansuia hejianensis]